MRRLDGRPLWLLDIDGVVNALARGPLPDVWPRDAWVQRVVITEIPERGVMTLPIAAARPVLDFIAAVHDSGEVDIRWHSTWRGAAVTALAPALRLPSIPMSVAPEWTDRPIGEWWKLGAAQRALTAGRRLVWTDDDLAPYAATLGNIANRPDALLIAPTPQHGLVADELERINAFLS